MNNRERRGSVKGIISVGIAIVLTALFGPVGATLVDSIWRLYRERFRLSCFSSGPIHIRCRRFPVFYPVARLRHLGGDGRQILGT